MQRLVVVGNGMVGQRLVETLRERDHARQWQITVLGDEARPAYDRVNLSAWFEGFDADALNVVAQGTYDDPSCVLHLSQRVRDIDRAAQTVTTETGRVLEYDALVLATGSSPFVPDVPGRDLPGCFAYRTLDDLDAIRQAAERAGAGRPGLVVGGGLLGLEAARALSSLGMTPHIVELSPRLMPQQVDDGGAGLLRQLVEELDVTVHLSTSVERITQLGDGLRVHLTDGSEFDVGVVVFSAGVRPRDELAARVGLEVGERGGIVVDRGCRTGDEHVWAVGECAAVDGVAYGLVAPGYTMAEVVADRLLGGEHEFTEADTATKLKLLGVDVASFGDALGRTEGALEVTINDPVARTYAKLVVSDDARTLLGGVLVGDASRYAVLRPLVGRGLPADPLSMISVAGGAPPADALPDDAQVCTCNGVTKGDIVAAITQDGASDVPAIKACTRAGTSCGSCVPLLGTLLKENGANVATGLCEHFDRTRAQLYDVIEAEGITTFSDLVARHGTGRGCDVCKPVVASILNSLGRVNHLLDGEQATLQDTNDHFLANMQRNGTYSVVPRIAGGEITAEKLIAIGEVARDFDLYTKITGGQRIDMFGARVEQLPDIWRRLVDAGFESGHAYGKAMRTVKSCVGSTWCRYGVQDSVALAVELELRYRGLRTPHKFKSGVSGCARECAEAQSKDFGVIATEQGWNLYVGGNGGFRPQHGKLLLRDVDKATLIRTTDRFLMFYIRTADRLQRTAPWLDSLDGGLDYLRRVLIDDELGIGAELDDAMARHVENYSDEWADVLADPQRLSRFVTFVNAPDVADAELDFVRERGQRHPSLPVLT
ncbi:nitrite reductase large subunit NirB [uncultured Jatrophihabitans sp.]|uniref:nitrite reductase large subunit NirB n=1 Tax=uncultured Jatrophihabitans sp. TaxID=1610747 RepID=UPI0035CC3F7C